MEITKRSRTELKSYFVKNAIPTESNFADLIDGALNQKDDGIVKLPGNPLSIEAAGDAASLKRAINLYRTFGDTNPDWTLNLNPRSNPDDASTGKFGFNISDGEGNSRLFIDRGTGNIGVGTLAPHDKLHVMGGDIRVENGTLWLREGADLNHGIGWYGGARLFANTNLDGAVVFGFAGGALGTTSGGQKLALFWNSGGNVGIGTTTPGEKLHVSGGKLQLDGNQQIKFTDTDSSNNLKVQLWGGHGLGINSFTLFYAANGRHSWRDTNGTNERMALTTGADGGLTVMGTGNSSFAGNVGIGTTSPGARLQVAGGAIMPAAGNAETAGILFPKNPGGGAGDAAWIRYYARDGEKTTLEIGTANDGDDHLALMASGNVGIGMTTPADKLDVAGNLRILTGSNAIRFTAAWSDFPAGATTQAEISNDTGSYKTLMIIGNRSNDAGIRRVSIWDRLEVNGTLHVTSSFSVASAQAVTGIPIVDFQSQTQSFEGHTGSIRTVRYSFTFTRPVVKAEPMLKAWFLYYSNREYVQEAGVACSSATIAGNTVTVDVAFRMKDASGTYDDRYGGSATVVVVAQLSQTL